MSSYRPAHRIRKGWQVQAEDGTHTVISPASDGVLCRTLADAHQFAGPASTWRATGTRVRSLPSPPDTLVVAERRVMGRLVVVHATIPPAVAALPAGA